MATILIIEDSEFQGRVLEDLLIENGYEILRAKTGKEAINHFHNSTFNLALMDMILPDMTGMTLMKEAKSLNHLEFIPIIVLSGLTDKENVIQMLGMGINDYITKPYHEKELLTRINIHLDLKKAYTKLEDSNGKLKKLTQNLNEIVAAQTKNLTHANDELKSKNQRLEQFAMLTGQNLADPVTQVETVLNLIDQEIDNKKTLSGQHLEMIKTNVVSLKQIINDMNHVLGFEEQSKSKTEEFSLNVILTVLFEKFNDVLKKREIQVQMDIEEDLQIKGIRSFAVNVFENLLQSAINNPSSNHKSIISIKAYLDENTIHCHFTDNAPKNILKSTDDTLHKVYQKFYSEKSGAGLGLYLVKSQMKLMGGIVEVTNNTDQSTTVKLSFPAAELVS